MLPACTRSVILLTHSASAESWFCLVIATWPSCVIISSFHLSANTEFSQYSHLYCKHFALRLSCLNRVDFSNSFKFLEGAPLPFPWNGGLALCRDIKILLLLETNTCRTWGGVLEVFWQVVKHVFGRSNCHLPLKNSKSSPLFYIDTRGILLSFYIGCLKEVVVSLTSKVSKTTGKVAKGVFRLSTGLYDC